MASNIRFNFNVGVLGHVDSGKTSLSKALSTTASTGSFDKNPQSKERGITLDLGFSSFQVGVPDHLSTNQSTDGDGVVQYTLVDCPGHASLIKTIIGGAQIIDLMILVVDVVKGMQTQTAECLVIGEITCEKMIVVLNKVDLIPPEKKDATIEKMKKRMWKTLENTRFAGCPIVPVAAKPGGQEAAETESIGLTDLIDVLKKNTFIPNREGQGPFIFSVDHCFSIRGQGTVMTGTALSGCLSVNDTVEIPALKVTKKVKSMQMFRKPVDTIVQGDRAGICVTQFDPKLLERGTVCSPNALPTIEGAIVSVQKISYYKGYVSSKAKFHITTGHDTVMGQLTFFGYYGNQNGNKSKSIETMTKDMAISEGGSFNFDQEYKYLEDLISSTKEATKKAMAEGGDLGAIPEQQFAFIQFEKPVTCQDGSLLIGSKLDTDIHANICRIAFYGKVLVGLSDPKFKETILPKVKVFKDKLREGQLERVMDEYTVIGKNFFKKETNIALFTGLKVKLSSGQNGVIEGSFGQSGKVKIRIPEGLPEEIVKRFAGGKKKGKNKSTDETDAESSESSGKEPIQILMSFKRYVFDPEKKMKQT